ncbi:MAG: aldolase/citrate lyase family protein [Pirellulaceae bacterium]|jgi:2-keto-3-deoxy-L-rhamnonate aldolase RhmA|nr:aldolase/citrate lyase family protein [Pirellulaceae bacterium]
MPGKVLKDKLIKGERVFGTFFQNVVSPAMVDVLPPDTLDFAIVSAEHNALELAEFLPIRYALEAKGIACLVRIHSRDAADVSKVCDTFDGVVVPYVEDLEQAKQLAAAAVFRPLKGKLLDRVLAGGAWPSEASKDYIEQKNADTVFIPMIESVPAIENLDAICSIPGVHAVFVGPGDLTCSMGIPKEYDHPDLIATIKRVIDTADRHHVAAGCWFGERRQAVRTIRQGARLVVYANEGLMMRDEMASAFGEFSDA